MATFRNEADRSAWIQFMSGALAGLSSDERCRLDEAIMKATYLANHALDRLQHRERASPAFKEKS